MDVEALVAVRRDARPIAPPSERRALTVGEAYALQERLRETLVARGERVIGWKVGLTTRAAQSQLGLEEPVSGFLLASGVFASGRDIPFTHFAGLAVEAEVALVMRHELAGPGVTAPHALQAVEGARPALELVDFRFTGKPVGTDMIADGVYAKAIVLGQALTDVAQIDLALEGLVYELNGTIAATATAAEVMGNPINSLVWLANHLGARGAGLRAGDVVMTGSVSMMLRPKAGDAVRATYTRLGAVAARFV